MFMAIHHSTGTHTWTSCPRVPLSEWIQGSPLTRQWLERLAKQLNSAESFDAASGDFYAELSFLGRISVAEDQPKTSLVTSRLSSY